ncbi:hypothetical protein, partial [Spirosoma litoris]
MNRFYSQQTHWVGLFRARFFFSNQPDTTCQVAIWYSFGATCQRVFWQVAFLLLLSKPLLAQNWNQIIKTAASDRRVLTSLGRSAGDNFGYSIAIDGDYAVVGALGDDEDAMGGNPISNAGSALVFKRTNGIWSQIKKLVATDRGDGDAFGVSVAISGGLIVVGASQEDHDAAGGNFLSEAGSAYVFSQNQGGTDNWGQVKKLVAADRGANDRFGRSVCISESLIVVGAYQEDQDATGGNMVFEAGSAYVFSQNHGGADNWGQVKKLVAADRATNDYFGYSVAISGSTVVVGAYQESEDAAGSNTLSNAGSAYVFSQNQGGSDNWGQVKKLVATDRQGGDNFGFSVAISGSLVVIGAILNDGDAMGGNTVSNSGAAYVFSQNQGGIDNWGQVKKLMATDRTSFGLFGISLSISGNTIVVGAYWQDEDAAGGNRLNDAGSAYVFSQNQGGMDNWGQVKKLVAADLAASDYFGFSVSISGGTIVVGAYLEDEDVAGGNTVSNAGSAYVFSQNQGGTDNWGQVQKVILNDYFGTMAYGYRVAIDGDYAVVGAYQDYMDASSGQPLLNAGSAYVLKRQNGTWTQIKKLVAADRDANDFFGGAVAISGNNIVVGAYGEDEDAAGGNTLSGAGSAYVFSQNQGGTDNWGQVKKLVASDRAANDLFGFSVAISGSLIVVGDSGADLDATGGNTLSGAGSAYVFSQNQGGTDNWGQVKKLVASDRAINDQFGVAVAISGSLIVVGANQEDQDATGDNTLSNSGSAYVFSQNQGGVDNWGQVKKLVAADRRANDYFGQSVGISGSTIVIGAYQNGQDAAGGNTLTVAGAAYVFSQNQGGADNWGQVKKLVASDRAINTYFGVSVNISGGTVVVGANGDSKDAAGGNSLSNSGSAYVFNRNQGGTDNWGQVKKLVAADRGLGDQFGRSVAISEDQIVVGAYQDDKDATGANTLTNAGSAYFFAFTGISLSGFIASPATICVGSGTSFSASIGNLTGSYNYTLTNGSSTTSGTSSSSALSLSLTATGSGTQTFTLIVSTYGISSAVTTSLMISAEPNLSAGATLPQANVGVTVSLSATGATSYQWSAPSTVLLTSPTTGSALSASLTTAGVQTFTLVGTTGICSQSALVSVTALAGPDLSPIILMPEGNFAAGETKGLLMKLQE